MRGIASLSLADYFFQTGKIEIEIIGCPFKPDWLEWGMQAAVAAFFISLTLEAIHGSLVFLFPLHRPTVQFSRPPRTQSLLLPQSHSPRLRTAPPNHPRWISLVFALPQASGNAARTGHPDV